MPPNRERWIDFAYRSCEPVKPVFHSHLTYEIYYFHEGKCTYLIGDQIYSLTPGDLILMYGMTLHCPKVDPSVPYVRSIVHFDPAVVRPFAGLPHAVNVLQPFQELKNYRIRPRQEVKEEIERLLAAMDAHQRRGDRVGDSRLMLAFVDLLHLVYDQCQQPLQVRREFPSDKEKTVQEIVTVLERHFTDELSMERLQQEIHLSKSYLSKIFKEVTGVTIFDYMYRRRINEARVLFLMEPDLSVTDVCYRLGFKHLAHFSRLFKRQVGQSPERYKRSLRNEGENRT